MNIFLITCSNLIAFLLKKERREIIIFNLLQLIQLIFENVKLYFFIKLFHVTYLNDNELISWRDYKNIYKNIYTNMKD